MVFDTSSNLKINLDNVNSNFLTQGGLRTYVVNDQTTPVPVTISGTQTVTVSGYVSSPPVMYDAFGRFRVSEPFTIFDSSNVNYQNTKFSSYASGTISGVSGIIYNVNNSMIALNCAAVTSGVSGTVIREGKYTCIYQPGKSLLILNSFVMTETGLSGVIQRVGYYNDKNGIYLEYNPSDVIGALKFVIRSNTTGTVTNKAIYQSAWQSFNTPTPSSINIGAVQLMWIDIEWLGAGTVRTGFVYNGQYYICAQFNHANILGNTSTYMTSAQLAPRYEIINSTTANLTLYQICSTVISEGGVQGKTLIRHVGTSPIQNTISPLTPILAIKLNDTISGTQNIGINGIVLPVQVDLLSYVNANNTYNGSYLYQIIVNPTISGTFNWTSYSRTPTDPSGLNSTDSNSSVQYWVYNAIYPSITANTGLMINAGYVSTSSVTILGDLTDFNYQIGRNYTGNNTYTSDIIVVVASSYQATSNTFLAAQIGWYEF